jgi:hypothetical protein
MAIDIGLLIKIDFMSYSTKKESIISKSQNLLGQGTVLELIIEESEPVKGTETLQWGAYLGGPMWPRL